MCCVCESADSFGPSISDPEFFDAYAQIEDGPLSSYLVDHREKNCGEGEGGGRVSEELKPCPLCGSTDIACFAEECGDDYDNVPTFRAVVACLGCHEEGCDSTHDDEAFFGIEAYYRADHQLVRDCEDPSDCKRVLERHVAERWNRRAERTCRPLVADDGAGAWGVYCSECGYRFAGPYGKREVPEHMAGRRDIMPRYCPSCGARVVSGDD